MIDFEAFSLPVGSLDDDSSIQQRTIGLVREDPWTPEESAIADQLFFADDPFGQLPPIFVHEGEDGEEIFANSNVFQGLMGLDHVPSEAEASAFISRVYSLNGELIHQRAARLLEAK